MPVALPSFPMHYLVTCLIDPRGTSNSSHGNGIFITVTTIALFQSNFYLLRTFSMWQKSRIFWHLQAFFDFSTAQRALCGIHQEPDKQEPEAKAAMCMVIRTTLLFRRNILLILNDLFAAETWYLKAKTVAKQNSTEMNFWRRSARISRKDKIRNNIIKQKNKCNKVSFRRY